MVRTTHPVRLLVALAVALPCATAAASSLVVPPDPPMQPTQPTQPTQPSQPMQTPPAAAAPTEQVTDAEIVTTLEIIDDVVIDHNQKAQKNARDRQVKKFADMRIKHAKAAKKRHGALRKRHDFKSTEGAAIGAFKRDTHEDLTNVEKGREYDRMYLEDEIESLTNILDVIDDKLMPYVDLAALRSELGTMRTTVESDLKEAQRLRDRLDKPTT